MFIPSIKRVYATSALFVVLAALLAFCALPAYADIDTPVNSRSAGGARLLAVQSDSVTVDIQASAVVDQNSGRKLLDKVNAARAEKGVGALQWDAELEETAIQRAVENVVMYSHTRPDGTTCFSAWPDRLLGYAGENIAFGYSSADEVNDGWTNSPGHYANMVNEGFTCMAAACATGADGHKYWVECFASGTASGMTGTALCKMVTKTVQVLPANASLSIHADSAVFSGRTYQLKVQAGAASIPASSLAWSSSDSGVATVDSSGRMTAVATGSATLKGSLKGAPATSASCSITVKPYNIQGANISYDGEEYSWYDAHTGTYVPNALPYSSAVSCPGVEVELAGKTLAQNKDYTVSYKINHAQARGIITIKGKGEFAGSEKTKSFDILPVAINEWFLSQVGNQAYTGKAIKPQIKVTYYGDKSQTFVKGSDYTVAYNNNVGVGTATITVTGKGLLYGTASTSFSITRASLSKAAVKLSKSTYSYDGKAKKPSISSVTLGKAALKAGRDYGVKYSNNVKSGTAVVTIAGKGNYAGSANATFTITKAANPMEVKAAAKTVKLANVKKKAQVVAPISFAKKAQGKVTYAKASGAKCLTVNKSTGKVTVKKGTRKGTYTAKVKVTAAGNANYKAASKTVTVKVVVK